MSERKDEVLVAYSELAKKLGKLPSWADCRRYGITPRTVEYHFNSIKELKEQVLAKFPELESLTAPLSLSMPDIIKLRFEDDAKNAKKSNKEIVKAGSVLEYLEQFAENVFKGKVTAIPFPRSKKALSRIHTLVFSDLHFGSDIQGDETGSSTYGAVEEARRFASIIKEAATYKAQYRDQTKLKVLLLGDIIENAMHDPRTGATIAEQMARAIHLLIQAIAYLSTKYPEIEVECSTGNHGRNTARHKQRAVHQKWDSLETIIYYAVKEACVHLKNVKVNIPKTPIGHYDVFGKKIAYTHGDTVLNVGNPGTTLNVKQIENQVNKLNAALSDKDEYSLIIHGHTHTAYVLYLSNGTILLGNGSLPPPDDFAVSIGIPECNGNGQWIFESVEGYVLGDLRYIRTGSSYDSDKSLDTIIKPWKSF